MFSPELPRTTPWQGEWMEFDKLRAASYSSIVVENGRVFYKKKNASSRCRQTALPGRVEWRGTAPVRSRVLQGRRRNGHPEVSPSWDGEHVVLGLTASGREWWDPRLNVSRRSLLPDSIYPSLGLLSWIPDSQSFLYDCGNITDIKSLDIRLNRKTRLHKIGTPVQADIDIFSNESHPELNITPKEWPVAYLDESYPRYVFGVAMKAGAELRLFYAPS